MTEQPGPVARAALTLTDWTERWVPDAFIFALIATVLVIVAALAATPATLSETIDAWGRGFWDLIPFTLQMALVIITGHVLATSPPMKPPTAVKASAVPSSVATSLGVSARSLTIEVEETRKLRSRRS